jgi:hypothetical protein
MRNALIYMMVMAGLASGVTGDFDGDEVVDVNDLALLAADWLSATPTTSACDLDGSGVVDMDDFADFAAAWGIGHVNRPPVAANVAASCTAGRSTAIVLTATDDMNRPMTFTVTGTPALGSLARDAAGNYIYWARPDSMGDDVFTYIANDGELDSAPANVTVTVAAPALDSLYLDAGAIRVYDGDTVVLDDSWTLSFWLRTKFDIGVVVAKRDPNGPGLVLHVNNGCPALDLYGTDGAFKRLESTVRIDDGLWRYFIISHSASGNIDYNGDPSRTTCMGIYRGTTEESTTWATIADVNFINSEDLYFSAGYDGWFWIGQIDAIDFYSTAKTTFGATLIMLEGRTQSAHGLSTNDYAVRFRVNEGTGTTIRDVSESKEGSVRANYLWAPEDYPIYPPGELRLRGRGAPGSHMRGRR